VIPHDVQRKVIDLLHIVIPPFESNHGFGGAKI
jgi:hypothetical protein